MNWTNIDNKHKEHYAGDFVSCDEKNERVYIKQLIKEEFPVLSDTIIDIAIIGCCNSIASPKPRKVFWTCLQKKLGGAL